MKTFMRRIIPAFVILFSMVGQARAAVPNDVNGDGEIDVVDVQCVVLTILGPDLPDCLTSPDAADLNCSGETNVVDYQLMVLIVLAHPQLGIPADKDADGDNIHDDCGPTTDCGNESCEEGEYCYSCPEDCSACPVVNPGQLIVTEFMRNSKYIPDAQGEWVEVRNMSPNPIYLNGWTIKDNGGDSHVITSADPVEVPPNGFLAIGANTDTVYNCGVDLAYQWSNFSLDDDTDEIIMLDPDGVMIDQVEYDSTIFPDIPGRACVLNIFKMNAVANDTGTNWCVGTLLLECGDWGNPGMMNPVCPSAYDCGNGQIETGEQCDDSNANPGDGCDENCQEEGVSICGNGELEIGEDCDDGNTIEFDGCDSFCFIEQPICGNNNLEDGEECDDGNLVNDDGCNSACQIEPECGNGLIEEGEQCDPPNMPDCTNNCLLGINDSVCGDGFKTGNEECDDGCLTGVPNLCEFEVDDNDGCDWMCFMESIPSVCGNNIVEGGEQCDPPKMPWCNEWCEFAASEPYCGDGDKGPGEECDDGCMKGIPWMCEEGIDDGDACTYRCEFPGSGVFCGNGEIDDGEQCDDGNLINGDGCDDFCLLEEMSEANLAGAITLNGVNVQDGDLLQIIVTDSAPPTIGDIIFFGDLDLNGQGPYSFELFLALQGTVYVVGHFDKGGDSPLKDGDPNAGDILGSYSSWGNPQPLVFNQNSKFNNINFTLTEVQ